MAPPVIIAETPIQHKHTNTEEDQKDDGDGNFRPAYAASTLRVRAVFGRVGDCTIGVRLRARWLSWCGFWIRVWGCRGLLGRAIEMGLFTGMSRDVGYVIRETHGSGRGLGGECIVLHFYGRLERDFSLVCFGLKVCEP